MLNVRENWTNILCLYVQSLAVLRYVIIYLKNVSDILCVSLLYLKSNNLEDMILNLPVSTKKETRNLWTACSLSLIVNCEVTSKDKGKLRVTVGVI